MNKEKLIEFIEEKMEEYQFGVDYNESNYEAGFMNGLQWAMLEWMGERLRGYD